MGMTALKVERCYLVQVLGLAPQQAHRLLRAVDAQSRPPLDAEAFAFVEAALRSHAAANPAEAEATEALSELVLDWHAEQIERALGAAVGMLDCEAP